jgi:cell wall-associated NlpC family hydrolase
MVWSYSKIGIRVPRTSAEQHQGLRRISGGEAQPGDFVFFDMVALGHTTHVGMLVGDLNGDGRWDMVHAASPELGVRLVYDVFGSAYYSQRLRGVGTVR